MEFVIEWIQDHPTKKIDESLLKTMEHCLMQAGRLTKTEKAEFSVLFTDEQRIQEINRDYRKIDKPTDVISFALNDERELLQDFEELAYHLGDILICIDIAEKQAKEYGHSYEREMCFLVLHGFLHLLGYDHNTLEEEQKMFSLQETVLKDCGLI